MLFVPQGLCHAVNIREHLVKLLKRFKIPLTSCEGLYDMCIVCVCSQIDMVYVIYLLLLR